MQYDDLFPAEGKRVVSEIAHHCFEWNGWIHKAALSRLDKLCGDRGSERAFCLDCGLALVELFGALLVFVVLRTPYGLLCTP